MATTIVPGSYVIRNGQIKLKETSGDFIVFDNVNEIKLKVKKTAVAKDSYGRSKVGGYDVTVEFNVLPNDEAAINYITGMMETQKTYTWISIQDKRGRSFYLLKVGVQFEMEVDANGSTSKISGVVDTILDPSEIASLTEVPV